MNKVIVLAATLLVLAAAWPVLAQRPPTSFVTGVDPSSLRFQPVDTSRAMRPDNINSAFRPTPAPSKFSLGSMFPRMGMPSWPPRIARTPILKGPTPFQPNPIKGQNPFQPSTQGKNK